MTMTNEEWSDLTERYRERFGNYPPYNLDDPDEHEKRVVEALEKDEPIPPSEPDPKVEI